MQKYISAGERAGSVRVVIVTLDNHLAGTVARAEETLRHEVPGLSLRLHAVSGWEADSAGRERCLADIASADIIIVTMLFMEDHIHSVLPALTARRDDCDAIVCCMSAGEVIKLTRLGQFRMDKPEGGVVSLLKRLRGNSSKAGADKPASGARQMEMLKRLPKILRFIPGTAQDVRAYFLTLQYWLAGSELNIANLVRFLVGRYGAGPRAGFKDTLSAALPAEYPEIGVYHPGLEGGIASRRSELPAGPANAKGTVGLLVMRSYLLARNTAHYDGVIRAFEAQGLRVVPAFASGLDARPAIETFFMDGGKSSIDALVSLTGFSLVGGPAYNDKDAAARILGTLDVPYIAAQAVEFQSLDAWENSDRGLTPVETTMMIAIPELDGATSPTLFGGRSESASGKGAADMICHDERAEALARRVAQQISLRVKSRAERKIGIVLFNFPPNAGSTGTAAFLSVYASLFNTLKALAAAGYQVDVPSSPDALRERILGGNAARFGTPANVVARIPADAHVRRERYLSEIEAQWGPAPGRIQTDGRTILVLGERFGNVLVGVQPGFGYEGDPMRLLFEKGFAPTHAFSAFYRYLREDFAADAVLHFGTHGALEFMPGKQTALSDACWPERLIGSMPNIYLYAANNPSEGTIAKRRSAATLVSYLTPPVGHAGLYRGLLDLKSSLERWRGAPPEAIEERARLAVSIQVDAAALELASAEPAWGDATGATIAKLTADVLELEYTLIPDGLHIVGEAATAEQRVDLLLAMSEGTTQAPNIINDRRVIAAIVAGASPLQALAAAGHKADADAIAALTRLAESDRLLAVDHELGGIVRALDGRYVPPAPSGDLIRNASILPTGRNLHGFDPFRIPSAFAVRDGALQADRILQRHKADTGGVPETIALVLWGTDNLKSEGGPIAQALALMGARPRFDSYGRLSGAALIPLAELGRPRIDVMMTL
ncbi:MAG: magnesium chelatase subunit H, partial [Hyphomicrobium sp.]